MYPPGKIGYKRPHSVIKGIYGGHITEDISTPHSVDNAIQTGYLFPLFRLNGKSINYPLHKLYRSFIVEPVALLLRYLLYLLFRKNKLLKLFYSDFHYVLSPL